MGYIYHYCCQYQIVDNQITYIDGVLELSAQIKSMKDYREVKRLIDSEHQIIITSLSLLGTKQ